jgi:hypothetical protein
MSIKTKNQSNPFSTGGGGVNFETRVQAAFTTVMLTKSCVPCMDAEMRAYEIKFQSKYDGADTDDFVLNAVDHNGCVATLYAQIKHEITITENNAMFAEVIKSGWSDFSKPNFNVENDVIALITGPLPKTDINNMLPILEWAKHSASADEFLKKANKKGFTNSAKIEKLNAVRNQLTAANEGDEITDEEFWQFLKVFQLIAYDLDAKNSTVASLLSEFVEPVVRFSNPLFEVSNTCFEVFICQG